MKEPKKPTSRNKGGKKRKEDTQRDESGTSSHSNSINTSHQTNVTQLDE
jgi:hypothetical protein